eukprot:TRINITY_DN1315_c0_g1_i4.p3 TRINITY_DN1315_c0_g1~~TRINITY_DN1315_c0_g1_i4.p3  ORF type:complete len:139 (-),score=54.96 TRINITY_DN1315_c0_g1_i4:122-538(-)
MMTTLLLSLVHKIDAQTNIKIEDLRKDLLAGGGVEEEEEEDHTSSVVGGVIGGVEESGGAGVNVVHGGDVHHHHHHHHPHHAHHHHVGGGGGVGDVSGVTVTAAYQHPSHSKQEKIDNMITKYNVLKLGELCAIDEAI